MSPPSPPKHTIDANYWHVLECVWWRQKGTFLQVTRGQFLSKNEKSIKKYGTWENREFNPHAEITLIGALVDIHRKTPTVIGVSKNCCGLCTPFIEGVNKLYEDDGLKWSPPGSHGNHYNVSLPNVQEKSLLKGLDAMKEYIYGRVIRMIEGCVSDNTTETPPYWYRSDPDSDHPPIASTYLLLASSSCSPC